MPSRTKSDRNGHAWAAPIVLVAEDDPSDRTLLQHALEAAEARVDLRLVGSGEGFLDYLYRRSPWATVSRPDLILLDLNMPRLNGREVLRTIKLHPDLRSIPVVILTNSRDPEDINDAYAEGANTYVPKPSSFDELVRVVRALVEFWFKLSVVPGFAQR